MSSSDSGTVINYGSGSDFLTSYDSGSGSTSQKVTVPTVPVPVPQHWFRVNYKEEKFRGHNSSWWIFLTKKLFLAQCCWSGFGIRCLFDPWILDTGSEMGKNSGSGSGKNKPDHISESLETTFWVKILKFFHAAADPGWQKFGSGMEKTRIRYPGWKKFRSAMEKIRIRDNISDPQHCFSQYVKLRLNL